MLTNLPSDAAICVNVRDGEISAWAVDPPNPRSPHQVRQIRPGFPVYRGIIGDGNLHDLAAWILMACGSQAVAQKWAKRFARDRLRRERSAFWSIPVKAVRGWVRDRSQGKLWAGA